MRSAETETARNGYRNLITAEKLQVRYCCQKQVKVHCQKQLQVRFQPEMVTGKGSPAKMLTIKRSQPETVTSCKRSLPKMVTSEGSLLEAVTATYNL